MEETSTYHGSSPVAEVLEVTEPEDVVDGLSLLRDASLAQLTAVEMATIREIAAMLLNPNDEGGWYRPAPFKRMCTKHGIDWDRVTNLIGVAESDSGDWICIDNDPRRVNEYAPDEGDLQFPLQREKAVASARFIVSHGEPAADELVNYASLSLLYMSLKTTGRATTRELIEALPRIVAIPPVDLEHADGDNEPRYFRKIRNLKSGKRSPGSIVFRGLAEDVTRGFRITEAGRGYVVQVYKLAQSYGR